MRRLWPAMLLPAALALPPGAPAGECAPVRVAPCRAAPAVRKDAAVTVISVFTFLPGTLGPVQTPEAPAPEPPGSPPAAPEPKTGSEPGPPLLREPAGQGGGLPAAPQAPAGYAQAVALLQTRCASCHTAGRKTSGGVSLFDAAGRFAPSRDAGDIYDIVLEGRMPPSGALSPAERKVLRALLAR